MKRTAPLNREAIVMAAMARIDADGLEAFSLREVARDLGVYPTALYWHVPGGRNGLLAAVAAVTLKDVAPPLDDDACWRDWLLRLFKRRPQGLHGVPQLGQFSKACELRAVDGGIAFSPPLLQRLSIGNRPF